MKIRYNTII